MINLDHYKNLIRTLIGEEGINKLSSQDWEEFTQYAKDTVDLHNDGFSQLSANGGTVNLKLLLKLHDAFNGATLGFLDQLSFGRDQHGEKVTFKKLFGDIQAVQPSMLPSICARFIGLWAMEHKLNMQYRSQPEYQTVKLVK